MVLGGRKGARASERATDATYEGYFYHRPFARHSTVSAADARLRPPAPEQRESRTILSPPPLLLLVINLLSSAKDGTEKRRQIVLGGTTKSGTKSGTKN